MQPPAHDENAVVVSSEDEKENNPVLSGCKPLPMDCLSTSDGKWNDGTLDPERYGNVVDLNFLQGNKHNTKSDFYAQDKYSTTCFAAGDFSDPYADDDNEFEKILEDKDAPFSTHSIFKLKGGNLPGEGQSQKRTIKDPEVIPLIKKRSRRTDAKENHFRSTTGGVGPSKQPSDDRSHLESNQGSEDDDYIPNDADIPSLPQKSKRRRKTAYDNTLVVCGSGSNKCDPSIWDEGSSCESNPRDSDKDDDEPSMDGTASKRSRTRRSSRLSKYARDGRYFPAGKDCEPDDTELREYDTDSDLYVQTHSHGNSPDTQAFNDDH